MVFTWLKKWEPKKDCIYDTEQGYWVNRLDLAHYVDSFGFFAEEADDFLDRLKGL